MEEFKTFDQKRKNGINRTIWILCGLMLCIVIGLEIAVLINRKGSIANNEGGSNTEDVSKTTAEQNEPTETKKPYVLINTSENTIQTRFNPPEGYVRVEIEANSFGTYMRNFPLKPYGENALSFSGVVSDEAPTLGVLVQDTPVIKAQQCADTCMLFYGEYCYKNNKFDKISFEFCDRFVCDFVSWAKGNRPKVVDNKKTTWENKVGTTGVKENDYSFDNFIEYMKNVYVYSNTDSLVTELNKVEACDMKPGDLLIVSQYQLAQQAKSQGIETPTYGHAMIVADMCVNEAGEKMFMLVEGTTPATEPVVVEDPSNPGNVWFKFDADGTFVKSTSGIKWQNTWIYTFEK